MKEKEKWATPREADNWSGLAAGEVDFSPTYYSFLLARLAWSKQPKTSFLKVLGDMIFDVYKRKLKIKPQKGTNTFVLKPVEVH